MPSSTDAGRPPADAELVSLTPAPGSSTGPAHPDDAPTVITAPPPADPGLPVGSTLGGFEVVGAVGAGGMATVLKAVDRELGREVALKILPELLARDPDAVTRFKYEARAAARLDHDNVARVFACGEDQGRHFIAFEFVAGDNLRAVIEARGPLSAGEAVRYMLQVAAGLAHAASRGVVHRDIKPSNIVITPTGRAKIVDMGLARNLDQPANGGVTQSGVTLGTFDYISPEQALDPRRADVRSDIYSLGCAFYHALTGRPPVPDGTAAKKLSAHQNDPVLDPRVLNPAVPDALAAVLARMMAKDPARRYPSPHELIRDLAALAPDLGLTAETPALGGVLDGVPARGPAGPAVPPALVVGVVALAAAVVVAVSVVGGPGGDAVGPPFGTEPSRSAVPVVDAPPAAPPPAAPAAAVTQVTAETADQLVQALANPAVTEILLRPGKEYDLAARPPVAVAPGPSLTLAAAPGGDAPPVVTVAAGSPDPAAADRASLVVRRPVVTLRGIRFVVTGPVGLPDAGRPAGVALVDPRQAAVTDCQFDTTQTPPTSDAAAVLVTQSGRTPAALAVTHAVFGPRRGVGLALVGRVAADVRQAGFAPHSAGIALDPAAADPAAVPDLTLTSCTFLIDGGAAVEAAGRANVAHALCVFAAPEPPAGGMLMADPAERLPVAVRSTQDAPDAATVTSQAARPSLYYRVDPAGGPTLNTFADDAVRAGDAGVVASTVSPWAAASPVAVADSARPWEAFRLRTTNPAARTPGPEKLLGAVELPRAGARLYEPWPPPATDRAAGRVLTVVRPDPDDDAPLPPRHYTSLGAAVAEARSDDVIEIQLDGPLALPPVLVDRPRTSLTIRPANGGRLTVTAEPSDRTDGSLFRLVDGSLTLENLDLRLAPRGSAKAPDPRPAAAVTVVAGQALTLRNCTVTLAGTAPAPLAAVALADPSGEMRDGAVSPPLITLDRTLVRGGGAGVRVLTARPFGLTATDTVFALTGPAVDIRPPARLVPRGAAARVRFERVTAVLAGPLIRLDPGRPPTGLGAMGFGWPAVEVTAGRSLFAAFDGGPVVTAANAPQAGLAGLLTWRADQPNAYANFPAKTAWAAVTPPDGVPIALDAAAFLRFTGEPAASAGRATLRNPPTVARQLADLDPQSVSSAAGLGAAAGRVARPGG